MRCFRHLAAAGFLMCGSLPCLSQSVLLDLDHAASQEAFAIVAGGHTAGIYVAPGNPETLRVAAEAFAADVAAVSGVRPKVLSSLKGPLPANLIMVGVLGHAPEIDKLRAAHRLSTAAIDGKWEAAETVVIANPAGVLPGVRQALVIAGSDRRGAAYALFAISRAMGVSPWTWWADVPAAKHAAVYVKPGMHVQGEPSVQYRGIFLNDEDWGLRPWAAKKMDPNVDNGRGNIGPHTYERVFELLLRLHANSLWPAMHPGTLAFNAVAENAKLADKWGIVMGSSHSEALLRNNVGEWNEAAPPAGDGPWNYQTNAAAMDAYWDKRLAVNGKFENFYTVGLRGRHDSGLEAEGTPEVKARLVEDVLAEQRKLLAERVTADVTHIPQVIWLYKESLDLYRAGMKVPDDVTLGWTDDNFGYIRELPNAAEQKRKGGSGVYYHVSYWGTPHDALWLCTTPPALIQEEMTKAYDHDARKYWILNVGDLKPAEIDIDYFLQLAADEPTMAKMSQREFLTQWFGEQFLPTTTNSTLGDSTRPGFPLSSFTKDGSGKVNITTTSTSNLANVLADILSRYYALNFIRRPEFMGFNGYSDPIKRTDFNPLAWGQNISSYEIPLRSNDVVIHNKRVEVTSDQNHARAVEWKHLHDDEVAISESTPPADRAGFFELVGYPVEASAAMNEKFLATDLSYLDAARLDFDAMKVDAARAHAAYATIQTLTAKYNALENGKWDGMMSSAPRERHVFEMPRTATEADAKTPLPASWGADDSPAIAHPAAPAKGFHEEHGTVSINAAHATRRFDGVGTWWHVLPDLGISGDSVVYGVPGALVLIVRPETLTKEQVVPWLDYDFTTTTIGQPALLALHLLPTFALDSDHRLRYAVAVDGGIPVEMDLVPSAAAPKSAGAGDGPSDSGWAENVMQNSAVAKIPLGTLTPGKHTVRLLYRDPGVVFEHLVVTFPAAPPAYPVPPETN